MHGWAFFGSHHAPIGQRIFWFSVLCTFLSLSGYLMKESISAYANSVTTIKTVDRTANLSDVFFPSVVICNINQLRKSFIYWLHDNIRQSELIDMQSPSIEDVFSHVKNHYFRVENEVSVKDEEWLKLILESNFYEEKFKQFYTKNLDALKLIAPPENKIVYYDNVDPSEFIGGLSNATRKAYHKSFLQAMAGQWAIGQMILTIKWKGKGAGALYYQTGYATDYGVCNWITPNYAFSGSVESFINLQKGALNGINNGLSFLLDAETFDYGDGSSTGVGFKIAVVHPMDIGIMESTAINVDIGMVTNIGVSTTLTEITYDAVTSFNPYERKCWMQNEIDLMHFPRARDYRSIESFEDIYSMLVLIFRYGIYNCLMEASMQEGLRRCSCYPGYLMPSNNSCQGESLSCFRDVLYDLGYLQNNV